MASEREWVESFVPRLERSLQRHARSGDQVRVSSGQRLPYAAEVTEYGPDGPAETSHSAQYETDILICDQINDSRWVPRVIVECKLTKISTHDALTYSTKAATHKHIHPYLRYGILAGHRTHYAVPGRLFRHGAHFDFMATWVGYEATDKEWGNLIDVLVDEIDASRRTQELLATTRSRSRRKYTLVHRPLILR